MEKTKTMDNIYFGESIHTTGNKIIELRRIIEKYLVHKLDWMTNIILINDLENLLNTNLKNVCTSSSVFDRNKKITIIIGNTYVRYVPKCTDALSLFFFFNPPRALKSTEIFTVDSINSCVVWYSYFLEIMRFDSNYIQLWKYMIVRGLYESEQTD